jgi:hypothetical protein
VTALPIPTSSGSLATDVAAIGIAIAAAQTAAAQTVTAAAPGTAIAVHMSADAVVQADVTDERDTKPGGATIRI